jgi:hypothetical protein
VVYITGGDFATPGQKVAKSEALAPHGLVRPLRQIASFSGVWGVATWHELVAMTTVTVHESRLQIHRLDFHFTYAIQPELRPIRSGPAYDYFTTTPFAKINWDHIRCQGRWEELPCYSDLRRTLSPEGLERWEEDLRWQLSRSNLFWFAEDEARQRERHCPYAPTQAALGGTTIGHASTAAGQRQWSLCAPASRLPRPGAAG